LRHFRAKQRLDSVLDLGLVRVGRYLEHDGPAIPLALDGRFLGDERPSDNVCEFHNQ
jgi:hypothetical protein